MTNVAMTADDRPKAKRSNGVAHAPVLVSGNKLAFHFGCSRQNVDQLRAQGVIERRSDGLFDQDVSRLKYLTHLRAEHRRSPRAAADAEFALAKAELVRIRIAEKKRELIPQEEACGQMEQLIGLFLTGLSGLSARCGGRDLAVRRAIDKAVYDLRVEIAEACTKLADQRGEPHWMTTHNDRCRDDRRRSRGPDRARRPLHRATA